MCIIIKRLFYNSSFYIYSNLFSIPNESKYFTLIPKGSTRYKRVNCEARNDAFGYDFDRLEITDWRMDFGSYEKVLLNEFETPVKCLKLLKYLVFANKPISKLWSYYLKTLIMKLILKNPEEKFWSSSNLFGSFYQCLKILQNHLCQDPLTDLFDQNHFFLKAKKGTISKNKYKNQG